MKKTLVILGVFSLAIVLAGCGSSGDTDTVKTQDINAGLDEFEFDVIDENLNTNEVVLTEEEQAIAEKNDEERISTVQKIQNALELYAADNGSYPEIGEELIPSFLDVWPADPGEFEYVYTPIGSLPAKFYDISYELEVGIGDLISGVQIASPDEVLK